jgi:replication protein
MFDPIPDLGNEFCPGGASGATRDFGAEHHGGVEESTPPTVSVKNPASPKKWVFDTKTKSRSGAQRRNNAPAGRALDTKRNRVSPPRYPMDPKEEAGRSANREIENAARKWRRKDRNSLQKTAGKILPMESVSICGRYRTRRGRDDGTPFPVAIKCDDRGHAHFAGIVMCSSVWLCPVCAAKISEGRRQEVAEIMSRHSDTRGTVYMATFTVPHTAFQKCADLRKAVSGTWQKLQAGKAWISWKQKAGFIGSIRSLEVTHGANGWHPHLHVLFFFDGSDHEAEIAFGHWLYARWAALIAKAGLGKTSDLAFRWDPVQRAQEAGDYVAKWGPDAELTKSHFKSATTGNRSPWQILRDIRENGTEEDISLFREYAKAFKRARQLTWSRGLREGYPAPESSDAELAVKEEPVVETVCWISELGYEEIFDRGISLDLLEYIEGHGIKGVLAFSAKYRVDLSCFRLNHDLDHRK